MTPSAVSPLSAIKDLCEQCGETVGVFFGCIARCPLRNKQLPPLRRIRKYCSKHCHVGAGICGVCVLSPYKFGKNPT